MKFAIVESRDQVAEDFSQYEVVFVLDESFEGYANVVSLPAELNGFTPTFRNLFLSMLGEHIDEQSLDKTYNAVTRNLGVRPSEVIALFEMNIYSRNPELSDIAKACFVVKSMSEYSDSTLTSYLRKHLHVNNFLEKMLADGAFRRRAVWQQESLPRIRRFALPLYEFSKGQLWLHFLVLRALFARFGTGAQFTGKHIIFGPIGSKVHVGEGKWCNYWRDFGKIEARFKHKLVRTSFQSGFFSSSDGRRVRPFRADKFFYLYGAIQLAIIKNLLFTVRASQRSRYLTNDERAFASGLRDAFWRSMAGPSFVQSVWDHHQFRFFFCEAKPKSVFFLCEGQPWEAALVTQGRQMSADSLYLGIAHTAIRPWDLRYFRPHSWKLGPVLGNSSAPDLLLVTSKFCLERLNNFYCEAPNTRLVETLRYPSLKLSLQRATRPVITVATTYSRAENQGLRSLALQLMQDEKLREMVRVRSHPLQPMKLRIREFDKGTDSPILTVSDSTSTVAVELAENGLRFITVRFGSLPNLSPLADLNNFRNTFAFPGPQLVEKIRRGDIAEPEEGFTYYERDPSWRYWCLLIEEYNL